MNHPLRVYNPSSVPQDTRSAAPCLALDELRGKVVGFIDNAKPNFQYLVDDLEQELRAKFGIKAVRKHRKPGQVPVDSDALARLAQECDAIITGSGD